MASPSAMPIPFPIPTVRHDQQTSQSGLMHTLTSNPIVSALRDSYNAFHARREALGLTQPGRYDSISQEISGTVFTDHERPQPGLQAEISNTVAPGFVVMHALASGSEEVPPYSFTAMLQKNKTLMRGSYSTGQRGISGLLMQNWSKRWSSRVDVQSSRDTSGPSGEPAFIHILSTDYTGDDFTLNVKGESPTISEQGLMGAFSLQYLQSVTPKLSLGADAQYLRQDGLTMAALSYGARYKGQNWIGSLNTTPFSVFNATYYRKLTERCHAGLALDIKPNQEAAMFGGSSTDATASLGTRYDFNTSVFRAKVDTDGKVAAYLESVLLMLPLATIKANIYAQMDHAKNTSKTGISFNIESVSEDVAMLEQAQHQAMAAASAGTAETTPGASPAM